MDPITLGILAVAGYFLVLHKPAPVMPAAGSGAGPSVPAPMRTPPAIPTPDAMVDPILGGLGTAKDGARDALQGVLVDVLGTARQRAVSLPTSPVDPAYPDQSSTDAARGLMMRGLAPLAVAASPVVAGATLASRTRTGQALAGAGSKAISTAGKTASDLVNAGASVADATQVAVNTAANQTAATFTDADAAAANFINRNSPF